MPNMNRLLKTAKKNIIPILIGVVVIIVFVVITIIFTDINPIIVGSASGVLLGVLIPAIIYRIRITNVEEKYRKKSDVYKEN